MTHAHFAWATAKMIWKTSNVIRPRSELAAASVERLTAKSQAMKPNEPFRSGKRVNWDPVNWKRA